MRCLACNIPLSPREATRKSANTGEFLDLCDECIKDTGISFSESSYRDEIENYEEDNDEGCV